MEKYEGEGGGGDRRLMTMCSCASITLARRDSSGLDRQQTRLIIFIVVSLIIVRTQTLSPVSPYMIPPPCPLYTQLFNVT